MNEIAFDGVACYNAEIKVARSPLSEETKLLVLETNHEPDYYSRANFPPNKHQGNWRLFLLVKKHYDCFQDVLLKKAYLLNKKSEIKAEIMPGQINYKNKNYQCVRINLKDISILKTIIPELESIGIEFIKDRKVTSYETLVFFKRYTEFIKIEDGVYKDSVIPGRYFFKISNNIEFNVFKEGIIKIKNNCNFHLFDSFQSFMFTKGKGQDFIGIYSEHCDEARFGELNKFIKKTFEE